MGQKERAIELQIIHYLRLKGCLAQKIRTQARFVNGRMISLPKDELGVADVIGCYKGKFFAVEVKSEKGRLSDHQKDFGEAVKAAGGIYIVAKSIDDLGQIFQF